MTSLHLLQIPRWALALACALLFATSAIAEDKPAKTTLVKVVQPLALRAGETTTINLRGDHLDNLAEIKAIAADKSEVKAKLKQKGKAQTKDDAEKKGGETEVAIELTAPPNAAGQMIQLNASGPDGNAPTVVVKVLAPDQLIDETEPNGGLHLAQPIESFPCTIRGMIGEPKDVDVYKIAGKAGQTIRAEITAKRMTSMLDATVSIYNARAQIIASNDDTRDSRDPVVEVKLPADGDYFIAVIDSNDLGGSKTHPYLLELSKP